MPDISNKRIAKNSIYLYIRKIITIFIGLYSSRLLFEELGIENYGLYGLVGSIIMMFASLKVLFTDSVQRFYNIEKGKNNIESIRLVFTYGVLLNAFISIIFIVFVEIGGYLIIPRLNIPIDSVPTAFWILQFSILSAVVAIMTVPYDAVMIANEKFNAYALFAIFDSILRFGSVICLCFVNNQKVIYYSFFLFISGLIVRIFSALYCQLKFKNEIKYLWRKDLKLLKEMTLFSSWNFFGKIGYTLYESGLNILLNLFGGVIVNAARSIAINIRQLVFQFTSDTLSGFKPQIVKAYGACNMSSYQNLVFNATRISFVVSSILACLCSVFCDFLIKIWLGEIPPYSVGFVRSIMLYLVIMGTHSGIELVFTTTAKLKDYQIYTLIIYTLSFLSAWIALKFGYPFYSVFIIASLFELIRMFIDLIIAKRTCNFPIDIFCHQILVRCLGVTLIFASLYIFFSYLFALNENWLTFVTEGFLLLMICLCICFYMMFPYNQRMSIKSNIINILRKPGLFK